MQKALNLPPCHFVSMSMNTLTSAFVSINYPEYVLSQILVSPVPDQEVRAATCYQPP